MKTLLYGFVLYCTASLAQAAPIIEATRVAGSSQEQVAKLLGTPGSCNKTKYGPKCDYKNGQIEIVFIKGRADWITINGLEKLPFNEDALRALGLAASAPSVVMPIVKRWSNVQGLMEISLFRGGTGSDYAYIKAYTP